MKRKEWKAKARGVLKRHYGLFVILCLIAAILGTECTSSLTGIQSWVDGSQSEESAAGNVRLTDLSQLSSQIITDSIAVALEGNFGETDEKGREQSGQEAAVSQDQNGGAAASSQK